jgi:hypothetical protein
MMADHFTALGMIEMAGSGIPYQCREISDRLRRIETWIGLIHDRPDFETLAEDVMEDAERDLAANLAQIQMLRQRYAALPVAVRQPELEAAE